MAQSLRQLRKALRAERCPEHVMNDVRARIHAQRRQVRAVRLRWVAAAAVFLVMLSITALRWSRDQEVPATVHAARLEEAKRVTQQAELSLTYIGKTLRRAGESSGETILEVSLPRLRQGLRTAREAISPKPNTNRNEH